ncbi:MAG: hypothetical protein ACK4YQ_16975 [Phenylobacterium sp.]|uniref:hypothetical protein n=1 Tax=Phenylobacterium sp. TaxID=1871053 RepID=UPI0039199129
MHPYPSPLVGSDRPNVPAVYIGAVASSAGPLYAPQDLVIPIGVEPGDLAVWLGDPPGGVYMAGWNYVGNVTGSAQAYYKPVTTDDLVAGKFVENGGNASLIVFVRGPALAASASWTNNPSGGSVTLPGWTKQDGDALYLSISGRGGYPTSGFTAAASCGSGQYDPTVRYAAVSGYTSESDVPFTTGSGGVSYGVVALRNF